MKKFLIFVTLFSLSIQISSAMSEIDRDELKCINSTISYKEMMACTNKARTQWESEIEKYYQMLTGELPEKDLKNLISSQRRWNKYKQTEFKMIDGLLKKKLNIEGKNIACGLKKDIVKSRAIYLRDYHELFHEE